ncbi:MAG: hypothetical protein ACRD38_01795, partial [Nitrososphaerales archaeon]
MSGESEIVFAMEQFERVHEKYLPKVDRMLVVDLFLRLRAEPNVKPMYTVEAFLKEGVDTQKLRNDIIRVTGV